MVARFVRDEEGESSNLSRLTMETVHQLLTREPDFNPSEGITVDVECLCGWKCSVTSFFMPEIVKGVNDATKAHLSD